MRVTNMKNAISNTHLLVATMVAVALLLAPAAFAAAPGIKGSTFNLVASAEYLTQPDGSSVSFGTRTMYHLVRLGLNYKFDFSPPVAAKY